MSNYAHIKTTIQEVVTSNGNNEITGALLQQLLLAMVNSLGADYQFAGIATPSTNPGTPDQNVFYIGGTGTYSNFSSLVIPTGYIGVLKYNGTWTLETVQAGDVNAVKFVAQTLTDNQKTQARTNIEAASNEQVSQLEAEVGDISDLQTQDTSNVVAAINEVAARHGFPTNAAELLVSILRRAVYTTDDVKADIDALEEEIVIYNLASISAVFTPGDKTFYVTESVEDLRPYLVVKAVYEDETEETINDYTLHGAFVDGTGTITIKYHGKSTTISVTAEDAVYYRDTFVNKLQLAYKWTTSTRHPATIDGVVYYFTRIAYSGQPTPNRRSSYYLFDLDLVAGKTYDFLFKIDGLSNDAIVSTGLQFHDATLKAAGIANEYEASANYESHLNDSTWQLLTLDNGYYTKRYTCPSGMVGVRPCLKLGSDDTTTWPDDAIVKEFIIKEVSNE